MRYVRFLKTPRAVAEKGQAKKQIQCLITITSDLGETFLPYDVELAAEILPVDAEDVKVWQTAQWTAGMRNLSITFPLIKSLSSSILRMRIGVCPKSSLDHYEGLSEPDSRGVVSAWSAPFATSQTATETLKLVQRRLALPNNKRICIWEETGESIARHLWDAGIAMSCHISDLLTPTNQLAQAMLPAKKSSKLRVLELGTGCGIVGIALAQTISSAEVVLTDLPEAREIVERNIEQAKIANASTLRFQELDWDVDLPPNLQSAWDIVIAADCTYNPDSSPALVDTLGRLAKNSPNIRVGIAMKMRHTSEVVFFDLMALAGFQETNKIVYPLPGDADIGEEEVYLRVYQFLPKS